MNVIKKISLLVLLAAQGLMAYDPGKSRVFEVMYQGPGGIDKVNKQVLFAETKNLSQDLNLQEISNRIGCKTEVGKAFLKFNLEKPISPFDQSLTVQVRQRLIKFLIDHPEILEKLELLIDQAVEHEVAFMKFMQGRWVDTPTENPLVRFFRWMDKNKYMSTYSKYMQTNSFLRGSLPSIWTDATNAWGSVTSNMTWSDRMFLIGAGLLGISGEKLADEHRFMMSLYMTAHTGYSLYSHYTGALATRDALYSLNRLVDIARQIEDVCIQGNVEHQFKLSSIRSEEGLQLLEDLNHSRYQDKESNLIISTLVNSFMYDVYEQDANLAPVYASIAEIDAYVALAKKMIALESSDHKFCFVEFLDKMKPDIQAKEFWNILVTKGDPIVNNLSDGRNIILTGANEGGKTTTIRAILQNIVLAQTFGVAAATEFKFVPYTKIHSYLNVSDDILAGKSRYAFELQQAKNILNQIESLDDQDLYFFVLDELFTGTNGEDGAQAAYNFIDNIASLPQIQFIYATHFNKLKHIGAVNPACVNYKIEPPLRNEKGEFVRDDKGEFMYPYKLSLGANDVNVALERAKDAGIFNKRVKKVA